MNCPICEDSLNEEFDGDSWIYKCDFCQYTQHILEPDLIKMAEEWYDDPTTIRQEGKQEQP